MITITTVRDHPNNVEAVPPSAAVSAPTAFERMVLRELYFDSEVIQLEKTAIVFRGIASGVTSTVYYAGREEELKHLYKVAALYFVVRAHFFPPDENKCHRAYAQQIFEKAELPVVDFDWMEGKFIANIAKTTLLQALRNNAHFEALQAFPLAGLQAVYSMIHFDESDQDTAFGFGRLACL